MRRRCFVKLRENNIPSHFCLPKKYWTKVLKKNWGLRSFSSSSACRRPKRLRQEAIPERMLAQMRNMREKKAFSVIKVSSKQFGENLSQHFFCNLLKCWFILLPLESWSFALAQGAPSHSTRPGSSFSIVTWAGFGCKSAAFGVGKFSNFQPSAVYSSVN